MTPIAFLTFTMIDGFGIRAGWFLCDLLIDSVPACIDAIERWRYRRELASPNHVAIVVNENGPARIAVSSEYASGGIVAAHPHALVGEHVHDFVRPRSHG